MSQQGIRDECAMCESTETTSVIITEDPVGEGLVKADPKQIQELCEKHYNEVIHGTEYEVREIPEIDEGATRRRELSDEVLMYNPQKQEEWMKWDEDGEIEFELSDCV